MANLNSDLNQFGFNFETFLEDITQHNLEGESTAFLCIPQWYTCNLFVHHQTTCLVVMYIVQYSVHVSWHFGKNQKMDLSCFLKYRWHG